MHPASLFPLLLKVTRTAAFGATATLPLSSTNLQCTITPPAARRPPTAGERVTMDTSTLADPHPSPVTVTAKRWKRTPPPLHPCTDKPRPELSCTDATEHRRRTPSNSWQARLDATVHTSRSRHRRPPPSKTLHRGSYTSPRRPACPMNCRRTPCSLATDPVHRAPASSFKTRQTSSVQNLSPPEPPPTTSSSPKWRGAPLLPINRTSADDAIPNSSLAVAVARRKKRWTCGRRRSEQRPRPVTVARRRTTAVSVNSTTAWDQALRRTAPALAVFCDPRGTTYELPLKYAPQLVAAFRRVELAGDFATPGQPSDSGVGRMVDTRRASASGSDQNPPAPPDPTMAQLLRLMMEDRQAAREERQANLATLQHLAQLATGNANNNNGGNGNGDHRSKLKDFQSTNPPVFSKCTEPLDADDWLRTIENNLEVAGVGIDEKVLFATHFLSGPARAWWENIKAMQVEGHVIDWEEFKAKFRKTHIPSGLIKLMKDKFMNLRQGSMSVVDYLDKFTTLSRYAPEDTNTEEKKKDRFRTVAR
ncbi:hypothetical protein QYE76_065666 [Lolium multiflorum]|uniref:Retrotransposon gag domain-containing protein n=1 Tax=Lolium multiflorum TaxID=4521 RepID=A0AAD8SAJ0_LOLMU|nr:hypothetical protein QYE76_065666 [Lolium multiflorum]